VRYFMYLLEKGFRDYAPQQKFVAVLDCNNVTRKNLDTNMLRMAAPVIENNFPER
jgi:hypothetical protein